MWNELESYKNHFLQKELQHSYKAEDINQMVKKEFESANAKRRRCQIQKLPTCHHSKYFHDHAKLAYGWFALPKLMRELCSDDDLTQWRAINSLSEFLLNPLNAQRAITEQEIVRKVHNCLMRIRKHYQKENFNEISELLRIFYIISNYLNGAEAIATRQYFIAELYKIITKQEKTKKIAAQILRNLSEKPKVLLYLQTTGAFELLCQTFLSDKCASHIDQALWTHLGHFLELCPEKGIKEGLFELFHSRIVGRLPEFHRMNMNMFALMLRCAEGQAKFDGIDGVNVLHEIFAAAALDTYEFLLLALLHGLHSKNALWRVREFMDLPGIIVGIAKDFPNSRAQLYSLQVLREMGQMSCLKHFINLNYRDVLRDLQISKYVNECQRDELMDWLGREIYDTTED